MKCEYNANDQTLQDTMEEYIMVRRTNIVVAIKNNIIIPVIKRVNATFTVWLRGKDKPGQGTFA